MLLWNYSAKLCYKAFVICNARSVSMIHDCLFILISHWMLSELLGFEIWGLAYAGTQVYKLPMARSFLFGMAKFCRTLVG